MRFPITSYVVFVHNQTIGAHAPQFEKIDDATIDKLIERTVPPSPVNNMLATGVVTQMTDRTQPITHLTASMRSLK